MRASVVLAGIAILSSSTPLQAQSSSLALKQLREGVAPQLLDASELATLGDPLFNLVLKDKADKVKLSEIQAAIQPNAANRHLFVVSEIIVRSAQSGGRRAVLAFDGNHDGEELQGNVMLSVSFGPNGLQENGVVEGWGWDNHRGRYNYYKLDADSPQNTGLTWKFRGSSDGADLQSPTARAGSCMRCHVVGAPVMKELQFPWNNWHAGMGGSFQASYLLPDMANSWPAAASTPFQRLSTADKLEVGFMIPAFKRFNTSRLNASLKRDDATGSRAVSASGKMTMVEARRFLRPLFETVETNLVSSRHTSGLHPFGAASDFVSTLPIEIPNSFFLNSQLIAGGGSGGLGGLKVTEAAGFSGFARLTQQENKDLITRLGVRLNGSPGDTHFGWFVPEAGFVQNDVIDQALQLGVITPHFAAAVLAVDVEVPVFSQKRRELLSFLPAQLEFTPVPSGTDPVSLPRDAANDLLTQAVIANIDQANPAQNSAAHEFRELLKAQNAVDELQGRVTAYANRVRNALDPAQPAQRAAELDRLYRLLIDRRRQMLAHPVLRNLDETNGQLLLPLPDGN